MCRGRNEETIEQKRRSVQARPPAAVLLSLPLLKLVRGHIASLSGFAPTTSLTFRSSAPPLFSCCSPSVSIPPDGNPHIVHSIAAGSIF